MKREDWQGGLSGAVAVGSCPLQLSMRRKESHDPPNGRTPWALGRYKKAFIEYPRGGPGNGDNPWCDRGMRGVHGGPTGLEMVTEDHSFPHVVVRAESFRSLFLALEWGTSPLKNALVFSLW